METSRSPLELMRRAYALGRRLWPDYSAPASRHDFTQPQLFACLVARESLRLSYRKTEAFLADVPDWLTAIGMTKAPDHNTMWRAFGALLKPRKTKKALDLLAVDARDELAIGLRAKPLTMDATCYEQRHRSPHYDRVCRKMAAEQAAGGPAAKRPGKWGKSVNLARSKKAKCMPKLALAAAAWSHRILAARASIGIGSDAPDFEPLLYESWRRCGSKIKAVVADAGYDSEANHCLSRLDLGVRSIIPPRIGRPTDKPPTGRFRRLMKQRFAHKADAKVYGQRSQSETINSMMKRNLGESLRSIKTDRRRKELLLRAVVHNLMLGPSSSERRD